MNAHPSARRISPEELANTLTHGAGLAAAVFASALLVTFAALDGGFWRIVSVAIYAFSLVFVYAASTFYHAAVEPNAKRWLNRLDHIGILLLIAGTYTPFALVHLRDGPGWPMFAIVWSLAVFGIFMKLFGERLYVAFSLVLYLAMGYLCVPFLESMAAVLPPGALSLLIAGGVAYTGGVVFFLWERWRWAHAVWHLFVIAGSLLHYLAILWYVLPRSVSVV
jgi:hemolysin III